jgi:hypothetical protein
MIANVSINLSKVEKSKLIDGKKGKYLPLTIFINDQVDQYGNNVSVIVSQTKEERDANVDRVYLGNGKTAGNTQPKAEESVIDGLNF